MRLSAAPTRCDGFSGGIYDFGNMSCSQARSVATAELEQQSVPGFTCTEVAPNATETEGATKCSSGSQFVVFASE